MGMDTLGIKLRFMLADRIIAAEPSSPLERGSSHRDVSRQRGWFSVALHSGVLPE